MGLEELYHMILIKFSRVDDRMYRYLNQYFITRIQKKCYFTREEFLFFSYFVQELKLKFADQEKWKNKLLFRLENLFLMSKDQVFHTDFYSKILVLEKKNQYDFSVDELCEYLSIVLSNVMVCISVSSFESMLKFYWQKKISMEEKLRILELVTSYSYEELLPEEQIQIQKVFKRLAQGNSKILIYVSEFMNELGKEFVDVSVLEVCIKKLMKLSYTHIQENEKQELQKLFQFFWDEDSFMEKLNSKECYFSLQESMEVLYQKVFEIQEQEFKVRKAIQSGEIILDNRFPFSVQFGVPVVLEELELAQNLRVIAIDDQTVPDKDGAFSIQREGNFYILNVYITDVVSFLKENRELCKLAYQRGNSLYVRTLDKNERDFHVDMLPPFLSYQYLSLNVGCPMDCVCVRFEFDFNGKLCSSSIGRKRIQVTDALTPELAQSYLKSKKSLGGVQEDLRIYRELISKVKVVSKENYLKILNLNSIQDLVAFPSIMVNYYLGREAEFAIYREFGKYSKTYQEEPYTHSATPLRRFVSDINLAFFLEQQGIISFPDKDLAYVERNIDEMIAHFNEQGYLQKFIDRNNSFVRKYIKK